MRILTFRARSIREGFARVRSELGDDALILDVRKTRERGLRGLFGHDFVEITAQAVDGGYQVPASAPGPKDPWFAILEGLILQEVNPSVARRLVAAASGGDYLESQTPSAVRERLMEAIVNEFGDMRPIQLEEKPAIVMFVGPPGVGKTTSILKLAASFKAAETVAVITTDVKRAGSTFQLRIYGDCLGFPVFTALSPRELKAVVHTLKDEYGLVFIDSPGCTHRETERFNELAEMVREASPRQVHLVVDMTMRATDAREVVASFMELGVTNILLTKADLTSVFGTALNLVSEFHIPLSYVSDGQAIPGSISVACPPMLASSLLAKLSLDDVNPPAIARRELREEVAGPV